MKKNPAVLLVWRKSKAFIPLIFLCCFYFNDYAKAEKGSEFDDNPLFIKGRDHLEKTNNPTCIRLSRGPEANLQKENPGLHAIVNQTLDHLNGKKLKHFHNLFHPRAKIKNNFSDKVEAILDHRYTKPRQFSVYRVWGLIDPKQSKGEFACEGDPEIKIISRFGYQIQYAVWLQIMGQNELGRIFISISPKDGRLWITGFHIQQWTHLGHDWEYWTRKGNEALASQDQLKAYFAYDIAEKLLVGGDFVKYNATQPISDEKNKLFSQKSLVELINRTVEVKDIVYVGTLMELESTGLFIRVRLPKVLATTELKTICQSYGKTLMTKNWLPSGGGIRCGFLLEGESPNQDGSLGGLYYSRKELESN